jgi:hypothetical protein
LGILLKTIALPSGDQEIGEVGELPGSLEGRLHVPLVSRLLSCVPSEFNRVSQM